MKDANNNALSSLSIRIGYTVLKSDFGEFVYAKRSKSGMLLPSTARVGQEKPERGLPKNLRPTHIDCKGRFCDDQGGRRGRNLRGNMEEERRRRLASIPSTMKNLVVPILWAGHDDRTLPNKNDIDILMNHQGPHALCPTGSVRDVFLENSYGTLTLESTVVDWVPMDNTEQYYAAGNSG